MFATEELRKYVHHLIEVTPEGEEEEDPIPQGIIFNFRNIFLIDSLGIGCILSLYKTLTKRNILMGICELRETTDKVFHTTQLHRTLNLYSTQTAAMNDFHKRLGDLEGAPALESPSEDGDSQQVQFSVKNENVVEWAVQQLAVLDAFIQDIGKDGIEEHYWKMFGGILTLVLCLMEKIKLFNIQPFPVFYNELYEMLDLVWQEDLRLDENELATLEKCIVAVNSHLLSLLQNQSVTPVETIREIVDENIDTLDQLYRALEEAVEAEDDDEYDEE